MSNTIAGTAPPAAPLTLESVRLRSLHRTAPYLLVLGLFATIVITIVLAGTLPASALGAWLGGGVLLAAISGWDVRRTRLKLDNTPALSAWEQRLAACLLLLGLLWFWLFSAGGAAGPSMRLPVQMLAFATTFTASVVFGASLRCYFALVPLVAAGQILWITSGAASFNQTGFTILLYIAVLTAGLVLFRRALTAGFATSLARRRLLAEHEALFNSSVAGAALIRDGKFVRINKEFCRIYGRPKEEIEGQSTRVLYEDDASWQKAVAASNAARASGYESYEREYLRPDGARRQLRAQAAAVAGEAHLRGTLFTVTDVTDSRRAEQALAARELAYRTLAESYQVITAAAPALIWAADTEAKFTFVSERGSMDILGVPAAEAIGKRQTDFLRLPNLKQEVETFSNLLHGRPLLDHVSEAIQPSGRKLFISTSGGPLHDAAGKVIGASGISVDITERQQRAAELELARDLLRNAIESIPDGFALFDANDRLVRANQRYMQLYTSAKDFSEISGLTFEDMVRASLKKGEPVPADFHGSTEDWVAERVRRHQRADGQPHTYRIGTGRIIQVTEKRTPDGGIVGVRTDITDLENARTLLISAVDSMSDGFVLFDADDRVVLCNQPYVGMLDGFLPDAKLTGMHVEEIVRHQVAAGQPLPPDFTGSTVEWIVARIAQHRQADGKPHIHLLADGRWIQSIRRRTPDGGIVVLRTDVTTFKQSELAAQAMAQHDPLTGLPNRRLLHDRLNQALVRAQRANAMVAVLLIDLDGFKPVNDTHGHRAGDEVLRVIAARLRECVRAADTVARYGGDEFVVVLDGVAQQSDAGAVAAKIIEAVARPIQPLWATARYMADLGIGCSIGISVYPASDTHPDALIRLADLAMYQAKQGGRGRFMYHTPGT